MLTIKAAWPYLKRSGGIGNEHFVFSACSRFLQISEKENFRQIELSLYTESTRFFGMVFLSAYLPIVGFVVFDLRALQLYL